jgi:hypothetical protein
MAGRVEGLARADDLVPPAGLSGHRMARGGVLVAGQGVADEDGVGPVRVQPAVGLVGDLEVMQHRAGVEAQGRVVSEAHHAAADFDVAGLAARAGHGPPLGPWRARPVNIRRYRAAANAAMTGGLGGDLAMEFPLCGV